MSVVSEGLVPLASGAICDFCSSHEVFQVYMAEDFTAVELAAPKAFQHFFVCRWRAKGEIKGILRGAHEQFRRLGKRAV
jgi:hypothetical protein